MTDLPRKLGLLGPSPPDYRDFLYGAPSAILAELPEFVDLRTSSTPKVYDQGDLGSCVANAANALVQFVETKAGDPDRDRLSRLFTYWYSRQKIGTTEEDSGSYPRDALKVLAERGVPRERFWPYNIEDFAVEPSVPEWRAAHHKVLEYRRVTEESEQAMRACLAEGFPFIFGFAVYTSFWSIGADGRWQGTRGPIDGYHAVAAWGYDFRPGALGFHDGGWIVRNSWSADWGDQGYFYVPRAWLPLEAFDCWTVRKVFR